jgi:lysophospholipase L1-like esterase
VISILRMSVVGLLVIGAVGCGSDESADPVESGPIGTVEIMPIGDSITAGPYYRLPLVRAVADAGCPVDFVGTFNGVGDWAPEDAAELDLDHQAVGAANSTEIRAELGGWIADQQPDVALVYLGTNDVYGEIGRDTTIANLEAIIGELRARNSSVTVLLAQIMPSIDAEAIVADLNANIGLLADRLDTSASPVVAVDMADGVVVETDLVDGVHPNDARSQEIADRWIDALRDVLGTACPL